MFGSCDFSLIKSTNQAAPSQFLHKYKDITVITYYLKKTSNRYSTRLEIDNFVFSHSGVKYNSDWKVYPNGFLLIGGVIDNYPHDDDVFRITFSPSSVNVLILYHDKDNSGAAYSKDINKSSRKKRATSNSQNKALINKIDKNTSASSIGKRGIGNITTYIFDAASSNIMKEVNLLLFKYLDIPTEKWKEVDDKRIRKVNNYIIEYMPNKNILAITYKK